MDPSLNVLSPQKGAPVSLPSTAKAAAVEQQPMTSMRVFREFTKRSRNRDGTESVDASRVISKACYDLWVKTRKKLPPNLEKSFQRSLSAHVTGVDGRIPFTPCEEAAVLEVLRRKERWPCFEQSSTRLGLMGFRAKGYHEKSLESDVKSPYTAHLNKRRRSFEEEDDDDSYGTDEGASVNFVNRRKTTTLFGQSPVIPNYCPSTAYLTRKGVPLTMIIKNNPENFHLSHQSDDIPSSSHIVDEFAFLDAANALLLSPYNSFGIDPWSTVLSIGRMLLISKGWFASPSMDDADRLIREYEVKYPYAAIIALDFTTRKITDMIVAMSPAALSCLGPVARNQDGLARSPIPLNDAWLTLTAGFSAYKNPGVEMYTKLNIICKDNTLRPSMCYFCMHPNERLLVLRI